MSNGGEKWQKKAKIRLGTLSVVKKSILLFIAFLLAIKTGIIFGDFFIIQKMKLLKGWMLKHSEVH